MNPKHHNAGSRNTEAKLSWQDIRTIRHRFKYGHELQRELAEAFGISNQQVSSIVRNLTWFDPRYSPPVPRRGPRARMAPARAFQ